jgi:transposase
LAVGCPPAPTAPAVGDLAAENRESRKHAQRLEQENEILRRATAYFARDVLAISRDVAPK